MRRWQASDLPVVLLCCVGWWWSSFCFDEQRLRAHETVDMPVFFYIDPKINEDRRCNDVNHLTLSYTFFNMHHDEEEEGDELPMQDATELSAQPTQIVQPA